MKKLGHAEGTFIHELPLQVPKTLERELVVRFECARQLYNACLSETLERLKRMRESRAFRLAKSLEKGRTRTSSFRTLEARYGLREYDLHAFAARTKNACHIGKHLDANTVQTVASRAFSAVREYAFGKRGRPRFKGRRGLRSIEGKTNASGIRWRDGAVHWMGLVLPARFDRKDRHGVEAHALSCRVKYVRIVRRSLRGRVRYYAQLVLEGHPHMRHPVGTGTVGIDVGPSTVAAVGEDEAFLVPFCPDVVTHEREVRLLQRKMDRSLRSTNPEAYELDGTIGKGTRLVRSKRYLRTRDELAELLRRQASARKTAHGALANRTLALGTDVRTEKLSYRAFQKNFGRSVAKRAPGMFVSMLCRKAESAGGKIMEFPTCSTRLSQTCLCGRTKKKPLSLRLHECECGVCAQRDLFSAFLARFVEPTEQGEVCVDMSRAREAWAGAEPFLSQAMSTPSCQAAIACPMSLERHKGNGAALPASFGISAFRSRSRSLAEEGLGVVEASDVVASPNGERESRGETCRYVLRTPRL